MLSNKIKFLVLSLFFVLSTLCSMQMELKVWPKNKTFLDFLKENDIPVAIYYNMDPEFRQIAGYVEVGNTYSVLKDSHGAFLQALINVGDEVELHIYKRGGNFVFKSEKTIYSVKNFKSSTLITNSVYQDIEANMASTPLARAFLSIFKYSIDFKNEVRKNDRVAMVYNRKYRIGNPFGNPSIEYAVLETAGHKNYAFLNKYDGKYYNYKNKQLQTYLLVAPLRKIHITSSFSYRRYHPILHIYRPHLGTDFRAKIGTRVYSAGNGVVELVRRSPSYGNMIEIKHSDGYETIYGHLSRFRRGIRVGKHVKKGELIAYSGSTGWSNGPHLHLTVKLEGKPIDPMHVISKVKGGRLRRHVASFNKMKQDGKDDLDNLLAVMAEPYKHRVVDLYQSYYIKKR